MFMRSISKTLTAFVSVVCAWLVASPIEAGPIYGFNNVTTNDVADVNTGEAQLTVEVVDAGSGQVSFVFRNAGPNASSITDVYFDDGTLLGLASVTNQAGVSFSQGASPGDLPSGTTINFDATSGFTMDSNPPAQPNGVNPGEELTITFNLQAGKTYADTLAALALGLANPGVDVSGGLRIGIHVQGFEGGGSESFVNGPPDTNPVPAPPSILLLGIGALGLGVFRRRRSA